MTFLLFLEKEGNILDFFLLREQDCLNPESGFALKFIQANNINFHPHNHDFYEIVLIVEGGIDHILDSKTIFLNKGSLVFIRPGDCHTFRCDKSCRIATLAFSKQTLHDLLDFCGPGLNIDHLLKAEYPPYLMLSADQTFLLAQKILQLNQNDEETARVFRYQARIFLTEVIAELFIEQHKTNPSRGPLWFEKLCKQMNQPENFSLGAKQMIALSGKSREYLSRCVQKYRGLSLSAYINNLRLNYAANLLSNSNLNILDISYECGFENPTYFHKKFKEKYGMTPGEYKKRKARL